MVNYNSVGGNGDTCVGGLIGYAHKSIVKNCEFYDIVIYGSGWYAHVAGMVGCYYDTTMENLKLSDNYNYWSVRSFSCWVFGHNCTHETIGIKIRAIVE